jgi:uncharacterized damage-inducible protein DinB
MSIELIRELWQYHHWANRRLFDVAVALGEETAGREMGRQYSAPSLREMFVHLYGADRLWLRRWKGEPDTAGGPTYGLNLQTLAELRSLWDELVSEQERFVGALGEDDLPRVLEVKAPDGRVLPCPLGMMLLHVPNHATHHRSEIATMLTIASGSPPDTGIMSYCRGKAAAQAV